MDVETLKQQKRDREVLWEEAALKLAEERLEFYSVDLWARLEENGTTGDLAYPQFFGHAKKFLRSLEKKRLLVSRVVHSPNPKTNCWQRRYYSKSS